MTNMQEQLRMVQIARLQRDFQEHKIELDQAQQDLTKLKRDYSLGKMPEGDYQADVSLTMFQINTAHKQANDVLKRIEALKDEISYPMHEQISDLKVMNTQAGFYVGREQFDGELGEWQPHSRISGFLPDQEKAEQLLEKCNGFKEIVKDFKPDFLETMKEKLSIDVDDDPQSLLKINLIDDELKNDRGIQTIEFEEIHFER